MPTSRTPCVARYPSARPDAIDAHTARTASRERRPRRARRARLGEPGHRDERAVLARRARAHGEAPRRARSVRAPELRELRLEPLAAAARRGSPAAPRRRARTPPGRGRAQERARLARRRQLAQRRDERLLRSTHVSGTRKPFFTEPREPRGLAAHVRAIRALLARAHRASSSQAIVPGIILRVAALLGSSWRVTSGIAVERLAAAKRAVVPPQASRSRRGRG